MAGLDKLTVKAQETISGAQKIAGRNNHSVVSGLHLLASMLEEGPSGLAANLLEKIGVNFNQIKSVVDSELRRIPTVSGATPSPDQEFMLVLKEAQSIADKLKDSYITVDHLLIALAIVNGTAKEILSTFGVNEGYSRLTNRHRRKRRNKIQRSSKIRQRPG